MAIDDPVFPPSGTERQPYLDVIRVLAVLGVVAIHAFGGIVVNPAMHGSRSWWAAVVVDIGNVWVVPAFVMVSGALLLTRRAQIAGPAEFYRRRLLRLGPAFVFWQVFYIVVARMWITGQDLSWPQILSLVADGNTYTHLYFLWLIVGLYVVAPILYAFIAQGGRGRSLILTTVLLAIMVLAYTAAALLTRWGVPRSITLTAFTQWAPYVGFFVGGVALSGVVLSRRGAIFAPLLGGLALAAILVEYGLSEPGSLVRAILPLGYPTLLTTIATLGIFLTAQHLLARWQPSSRADRVLRTLSDAAFGVFLLHFAVMLLLRAVMPWAVEAQRTSFWGTALVWLMVATISFAIAIAARRVPYLRRLV